jgi:eukaryotic-like serine/threonine-protein kinase
MGDSLPRTWQRLRALFAEAIQLDRSKRGAWLEKRCADDPAAARQIVSLLAYDESGDRFLESPAWNFGSEPGTGGGQKEARTGLLPGAIVGSWQILHEISSGGMGTVYLAERAVDVDQPAKQRAAIKVMRQRVDPELFAARFRRERQILAQLSHPFIARFLEAGTLDNGLPYFAVDYIDGEPIRQYMRDRRPPLTEILELFCGVCSAVAYAHRNLVVHRDLKPSNILVAADGTPRLIDFGIAKVLVNDGTGESPEQTIGIGPCTPAYSSPEQIRGQGITTATDIFALGIILYELVTGVHPFATSKNAEPVPGFEILRRICEEEPRSFVEPAGKQDSHSGQQLKGDLRSIVLKALRKNPAERYRSVEYLIDDIHRLLRHLPVLARPQSWQYRTSRLIRRHPTATVSTGLVVIVGLVAFGLTLSSDRTAKHERDYALEQRELAASAARAMIDSLASSLENMSAPIEHRLELLNKTVGIFDQIDGTSRGEFDPARELVQVRAEVRTQLIVASALHEMGDAQGAMHRARGAETLARRVVGLKGADIDDRLLLTETLIETSRIGLESGAARPDEALAEAIATLRGLEKISVLNTNSRNRLEVLLCKALVLKVRSSDSLAEPEEARRLLTAAIDYGTRAYQERPANLDTVDAYASSLEELGSLYFEEGKLGVFLEPVQKALAIRRKAAADAPANIRLARLSDRAIGRWGSFLAKESPNEQATAEGEELSMLRRLCAIDPNNVGLESDLIRELTNYGVLLGGRRQYTEAISLLREVLRLGDRLDANGITDLRIEDNVYNCAVDLALSYRRTGDLDAAKTTILTVLEPVGRRLESLHPNKLDNRMRQASLLIAKAEVAAGIGRWGQSKQLFAEALDNLRENLRLRDYPEERAFYGCHLARYGKTICEEGDIRSGCGYIQEGLQVMLDLQKSGKILLKDDLLNDISDGEKDLQYYQQRSAKDDNATASAEP